MDKSIILVLLIHASAVLSSEKSGKVLNVFNVVTFPNDECTSSFGTTGVCYTQSECTSFGGTASGTCASGFGVCCLFSAKCGASTQLNNTYFESTDSDSSPCSLTVCRATDQICQIRMDFDTFDIDQPSNTLLPLDGSASARTQCQSSRFIASTDAGSAPTLCGTNTGYHMIVEASATCNSLAFYWGSDSTTRTWKIKVSQIPCSVVWKAPEGCTQWFTGASGTIVSYNYQGGIHLASHNYKNCIRQEEGYCSIAFSSSSFQMSGTSTTAGSLGSSCTTDYVMIPRGGTSASPADTVTNYDRFCGGLLGTATPAASTVYTARYPFMLGVYTDSSEVNPPSATELALGFSVDYALQTSCT